MDEHGGIAPELAAFPYGEMPPPEVEVEAPPETETEPEAQPEETAKASKPVLPTGPPSRSDQPGVGRPADTREIDAGLPGFLRR